MSGSSQPGARIAGVADALQARIETLPPGLAAHRVFAETYRRTTLAVGQAVSDGGFEDPDWVEEWDVVFAGLYLAALDAELAGTRVPRPWRVALGAADDLPPLRRLLLGINAHINYDLPQALLAVISDADFRDERLLGRRRRDHERIDAILASRVAAEDDALAAASPGSARSALDRALQPLNRLGSKGFLRESRQKVWHNTHELQAARVAGPRPYAARLAELEVLSAAKIADLLRPGQVILRLAVAGFGVTLPPPD